MNTDLCKIMTKHGSDKGNGVHNYTTLYFELFNNIRFEKLNIFELGLGTNDTTIPSNMGINGNPGASLRGWKEFFPNSYIFGADIDTKILFSEDRIETFYCDQTDNQEILRMWDNEKLKNLKFNIIIDDGLHLFHVNLNFLKNSLNKLETNGIYICEDLTTQTFKDFSQILNQLQNEFTDFKFELIVLENPKNTHNDNNLLIVKKIS